MVGYRVKHPLIDWEDVENLLSDVKVLIPIAGVETQKNANVISELIFNLTSFCSEVDVIYCPVYSATLVGKRIVFRRNHELEGVRELLRNINIKCNKKFGFSEMIMHKPQFSMRMMPYCDRINSELFRSIQSVWMSSNLKTLDFDVVGRAERKLFELNIEQYEFGRNVVRNASSVKQYDFVLVPNGRFPWEVGMKHEASISNARHLFYENGTRDRETVFLQPFQTQDIAGMNSYFSEIINRMTPAEVQASYAWAEQWLVRQRGEISQNPFIVFGPVSQASEQKGLRDTPTEIPRTVPIFTSSIDERFSNLAMEFNGWRSQNEAIILVAEKIRDAGMRPYVRIHPNAGWKSAIELVRLIEDCEANGIEVQLPWLGPSTYDLIRHSSVIVTWGSTLSLEATARGVNVFNLGRTRYDNLIDIKLISKDTIQSLQFGQRTQVDVLKSLLAIYVTRHWGIGFRFAHQHPIFYSYGIPRNLRVIRSFFNALENLVLRPNSFVPNQMLFFLARFFGKRLSIQITLLLMRFVAFRYSINREPR